MTLFPNICSGAIPAHKQVMRQVRMYLVAAFAV